ncbi:MAG TPA: DUF6588 family protein [Bacteriovoracaceae bacterium]|nr:DUF6588 family protein [Bacteriovoracaceae bacterium]
MKKWILAVVALASLNVLAQAPEFKQLTKKQLEDVSNEFAMNFSHTAVAAPETDGVWGVEIGLVGGQTKSPTLKEVVNEAGEDGSEFDNLYHAALMARAHFPLDLFAELTVLPERELAGVSIDSSSIALGWNAGDFFDLPLDLAVGINLSTSEMSFEQTLNNASTGNTDVNSKVNMKSKTRVLWVGASKTFAIFTPYVKLGTATSETDVDLDASSGTIFTYSSSQKDNVSSSGSFIALGANVDLLLIKLGVEATQTADVKRISGKLSFAF